MSWLQLHLYAEKNASDAISEILQAMGAEAITYTDASDTPIFEPKLGTTPLWQQTQITGLFPDTNPISDLKATITEQLDAKGISAGLTIEPLKEQVWERAWMDEFHPVKFGSRLWICPSWTPPPEPSDINILMDPGLAFGSGSHPTTAMCLTWLSEQDLTGKNVLDYGCGSGVLGIAASRLGAEKVWAIDIDPQALIATRNNSLRNHAENVFVGLPDQLPKIEVDLIVANILAAPLATLVDAFWALSHIETGILLSGVLSGQVDSLIQAYSGKFELSVETTQEDWVLLHGFCSKNML